MGNHIRKILLHVIRPCRATTGQLGENPAAFGKALHELGSLFHYGEIGSEVGVKYRVDPEMPQGRVDFFCRDLSGFVTEGLTEGDPHRWCNLHGHMLRSIPNRIQQFCRFILFIYCTYRAMSRALSAFYARTFRERGIPCRGNSHVFPSSHKLEGPYSL